nr:uncharacterized protein CI109_006170 [Kwoniella shandongensis]KAA5525479.1 hypothetical protein CI109_006170 [Kwoniella shandongensis]
MTLTINLQDLNIDFGDQDQVIQYMNTHSQEEVQALEVALCEDAIRMSSEIVQTIDKMIEDSKASEVSFMQHLANVYISSMGGKAISPPSKRGKKFPDGMPKKYRNPRTFQQYISLPTKHLNAWFLFYKPEHEADIDTFSSFQKAKAIWEFIGGHPDQIV